LQHTSSESSSSAIQEATLRGSEQDMASDIHVNILSAISW